MMTTVEELEHIRMDLTNFVYETVEANEGNSFKCLNTVEFGEIIKMLKETSEALYYAKLADGYVKK